MGDVRGRLERLLCVLATEVPLELPGLLEKVEGMDDHELPLVVSLFVDSSSSSSSSSTRHWGRGEWCASKAGSEWE